MEVFEIDALPMVGQWAYVIHRYERGHSYGEVYLGEHASADGFASKGDALRAAADRLDEEFGGDWWCRPSENSRK